MTEPASSDSTQGQDPISLFWAWDTGIGDAPIDNEAYLSNDLLQLELDETTPGIGQYLAIPLDSIRELHLSKRGRILEIYYDSADSVAIWDPHTSVHRELYGALRKQIAPDVKPIKGTITPGHSINKPATALLLTIFLGGLLLAIVATYQIEWFPVTLAVVSGTAIACAAWMIFRFLVPLRAEVVVIKRPE